MSLRPQAAPARGPFTARPTVYRGIHMRSRLEARVAAWLDEMGFDWEYEPQAYGGRGRTQYLPDFVFKSRPAGVDTILLEVKPTLELAYLAMARMTVAWQSDPDALLAVVVPGLISFQAAASDWTFRVRPPVVP